MGRTQPGVALRLVARLLDQLGQTEVGQAGNEVIRVAVDCNASIVTSGVGCRRIGWYERSG